MKKILFAVVLFSATTIAFAQNKPTTEYNAMESTRLMRDNLQLNEGQYVQIKTLNTNKQERYRDIDQMYRNDPQMRQQKLDALNAEMDREYQSVLQPSQYTSYLEMEGRPVNTGSNNMGNMNSSDQMNMGNTGSQGTGTMVVPANDQSETKIKTSDTKIKSEPGKTKAETPAGEMKTKTSGSSEKNKVKTADGHKIKEEKDSDKYKYQDSRDNSKVKAKDDKLKIEDKNSKIKVEEDKVKIKTRD